MTMTEFEELAFKFLAQQGENADNESDLFRIYITSAYKFKRMVFETLKDKFEVTGDSLEEVFDKAYQILQAYYSPVSLKLN